MFTRLTFVVETNSQTLGASNHRPNSEGSVVLGNRRSCGKDEKIQHDR
jgi:hypothetical protein